MEMKRFLLFEFSTYYPAGGLSDCSISFDTLDEAMKHIREYPYGGDERYVWDRIEGRTVWDRDAGRVDATEGMK